MSFNLALALLPHTTPAAIGATGAASLSFDEATGASAQGAAAAAIGPHTIVVDPTMQLPEGASEPTFGTLVVDLAGTADVYVVRAWNASPRLRVLAARELAEDQGDPLPHESVLNEIEDPEDAHLDFFCRAAGLTVEQLFALQWVPTARQ